MMILQIDRVSHRGDAEGLEQRRAYEETGKNGEDNANNLKLRRQRDCFCSS